MNKKQFIESLKGKTIRELLELLEHVQAEQIKLEPDNIDSVIEELNTRQLSKKEETEFGILMNLFFEDGVEKEGQSSDRITPINTSMSESLKEERELISNSKKEMGGLKKNINEANKNYKVVPFNPSDNVPSSLQSIIDSESINGWEYVNHEYSDKLKPGDAGCFGIGATSDSTIHIGFVVFKKMIK